MTKNDFLPFATADGANVLSAEDYQTLHARSNGFSAGVARSQELNTVWRQASVIAHVVAQFIADTNNSDVADDGDLQTLQDGLRQALSQHINHTVKPASLTTAGITQLSSATHSDSETMAATPKAVKAAMDLAASSSVKSVNGKKGEVQLTAGDVGALAQTGGTVNGSLHVTQAIHVGGNDSGLRANGDGNVAFYAKNARIAAWNEDKLHWLKDVEIDGMLKAKAAQFGGNIAVSWGGRTATFHENGDVTGPIWGGALSAWIKNRTQVSGGRGGWWYKDESTGFIFQGGVVNRSDSETRVSFPRNYQRECFGVQLTPGFLTQGSRTNLEARHLDNNGFTSYMGSVENNAYWWAVGV